MDKAAKKDALVNGVRGVENIMRGVLGPFASDKMLVDEVGDFLVTNDGATIVSLLNIEHPAAKVLIDIAKLQDDAVGDGTTTVVLLAAEILSRLHALTKQHIHATTAISGCKVAIREAVKFLQQQQTVQTSTLGPKVFHNIARTSLSSKILSIDSDHFADMVVNALKSVKKPNMDGDMIYPVSAIGVLKQHGKSAAESTLVDGFALNCVRAAQGMPQSVVNAKIALVDFDLRVSKLKLGIQIQIENPEDLKQIRQREVDWAKDRIKKIKDAGANVILTTKGMDDLSMKYMVEAGMIGVRRCKKDDLKRIAKATGGSVILNMASLETDDEVFDPKWLGTAEAVSEERFADDDCLIIRTKQKQASIILRGANSVMLDEMERALNDALQTTKRAMESSAVVPGGGACESALSVYLEKFAETIQSREQVVIMEVAQAMQVIPRQLAINAGLDAVELSAKLRVQHHKAINSGERGLHNMGLDLETGVLRDCVEAGVLEPTLSKVKSLQYAAEAAISILRIDEVFFLEANDEVPVDECC